MEQNKRRTVADAHAPYGVATSVDLVQVVEAAGVPGINARPLFASGVAAGFPSPADDHIEQQLDLNAYFITKPEATFYCRVAGESMSGVGIFDGDVLIVDRSLTAAHNDIIVAVVDDGMTVKRLYRRGNRVALLAENQAYRPIELKPGMELIVWGVVIGVTRKIKTA